MTEMKDVVFCVRDMHMVGGKERAVAHLANALSCQTDVSLLFLNGQKESFYPLKPPVKQFVVHSMGFLGKPKGFKTALLFVIGIVAIYKFIKREKPAILVGNDFLINILLVVANFLAGETSKVIGWEHLTIQDPVIAKRNRLVRIRNWFYRRLTLLVVVTLSDLSFCQKEGIKASLIPYPKSFSFDKKLDYGQKKVLTIARLSYQKGLDLYIELIARMTQYIKEWKFILVAKEDDISNQQFNEMLREKNVENIIERVEPQLDVAAFYQQASIFLLTSRYEGLPITLIEAQSFGLPCVSFDCKTGPADIINNGKDGFVIPTFNLDEMESRLLDLMEDISLRQKMGEQAKKASERFDPDLILNQWVDLLSVHFVHSTTK